MSGERTEVVRRARIPESFLGGAKLGYGALAFNAAGQIVLSGSPARGVLRDPYCNAVVISYASLGSSAPADNVMIRIQTQELGLSNPIFSPSESDIVILHSPSLGIIVVPLFCLAFSFGVYVMNSGGTTYPTNVDSIVSLSFS